MPTPYVKKEAEKHHESVAKSEATWDQAKSAVTREYGSQEHDTTFWKEVMAVYKRMMGE